MSGSYFLIVPYETVVVAIVYKTGMGARAVILFCPKMLIEVPSVSPPIKIGLPFSSYNLLVKHIVDTKSI